MPALKVPNRTKAANIPIIESRVPKPEELVVLSKPLLEATIRIGELLKDCPAKWAFAGDLGEILFGVNVQPDHMAILTTSTGCGEISKSLASFQLQAPRITERQIKRSAEIDLKALPISIKSYSSSFNIQGQRLDVHGDLQIKVGDWDWGDPIDYEPEYVYVVSVKVPVAPLELKKELYRGLGWYDRVSKINAAMARRHHKIV
jgi:hypothetical protein